ncbi:MAG: Lrp/AsnC family transcriptional regulator [Promethearchaeota archaeon]
MSKYNLTDLDETDLEILKILCKDGRKSHRSIADELQKSPVTIKKHVDKLEEGIIDNYGATINYDNLGYDIIAFIELTISKGKMLEVEKEIAHYPNIFGVFDVTGTYDAILLGRFKTRSELSEMVKKINSFEFIVRTNTHLILNVIKNGTDFTSLIEEENKKAQKQ